MGFSRPRTLLRKLTLFFRKSYFSFLWSEVLLPDIDVLVSVVGEEADLVVPLSGGCVETVVLELAVDGALQDCPCRVKHLFQQGCRLFLCNFCKVSPGRIG